MKVELLEFLVLVGVGVAVSILSDAVRAVGLRLFKKTHQLVVRNAKDGLFPSKKNPSFGIPATNNGSSVVDSLVFTKQLSISRLVVDLSAGNS